MRNQELNFSFNDEKLNDKDLINIHNEMNMMLHQLLTKLEVTQKKMLKTGIKKMRSYFVDWILLIIQLSLDIDNPEANTKAVKAIIGTLLNILFLKQNYG